MTLMDRDVFIRNHVMGVLVSFSGKGLTYANMGELADSITEAVMEGEDLWRQEKLCEEVRMMGDDVNEDIPQ